MPILYSLNVAFAIALILAPVWWSRRLLKLAWLNPVSIGTICASPIELSRLFVGQTFIGDGLFSPPYQFAVLMTNIEQLIALLLFIALLRSGIAKELALLIPRFGSARRDRISQLSVAFLLLYIVTFLVLTTKTGGLIDWLSDIRNSYIQKREGNGLYYAAAISFLSLSYFLYGFSSTRPGRFSLLSPIFFLGVYILGSKGFFLQFFIFYLIIMWRLRFRHINSLIFLGLPMALGVLLANFFSNRDSIDFTEVAEYFDYYTNAAMYYDDYFKGAIQLFGGKVLLTSLWEYVPRGLFPDKPYVYGILHVVDIYYPGGAESGNTPAFYGGVFHFADFGVVGVMLFSIFNVSTVFLSAAMAFIFNRRSFTVQQSYSGRQLIINTLIFAPAFGTFMPTGLLILFMTACFLYAKVFLLFTPRRRRGSSHAVPINPLSKAPSHVKPALRVP